MTDPASPQLLDTELLHAYESRLRTQGLPVDEWAKPGLSEDEMTETLAPLGLRLPVEGQIWWGWHDGGTGDGRSKLLGRTGDEFLSLSRAVATYREFRKMVLKLVEPDIPPLDDPDYRWDPAWFPILGPQRPVVIDCSVPEGQVTPLRVVSLENVEGSPKPRAQSLGQLVRLWIKAIDSGAWWWDAGRSRWEEDRELMDDECRISLLL